MNAESELYVIRPSNKEIALNAIKRQGVTITIKGPRQMGKSSLLMRTINEANKADKTVAFLDFQLIDKAMLKDGNIFFKQFCSWLTDSLDIEDRVEEYWRGQLNPYRCTRYLSKYLLEGDRHRPLVFAMDEVDSIFEADFRSDFFGMLRSLAQQPTATGSTFLNFLIWLLVTSTEPYQLIENLNQSPFNVGEVLELDDFNDGSRFRTLSGYTGLPFASTEAKIQLMTLLCMATLTWCDAHFYLVATKAVWHCGRTCFGQSNGRYAVLSATTCVTTCSGCTRNRSWSKRLSE